MNDENDDESEQNSAQSTSSTSGSKLSYTANASAWKKLSENCQKKKSKQHDNYDSSKFVSQYRKPLDAKNENESKKTAATSANTAELSNSQKSHVNIILFNWEPNNYILSFIQSSGSVSKESKESRLQNSYTQLPGKCGQQVFGHQAARHQAAIVWSGYGERAHSLFTANSKFNRVNESWPVGYKTLILRNCCPPKLTFFIHLRNKLPVHVLVDPMLTKVLRPHQREVIIQDSFK